MKDGLQDDNIDHGLVIGHQQIPCIGLQARIDALDIPADIFAQFQAQTVEPDPALS